MIFNLAVLTSEESPRFDGFSVVLLLPSSSSSESGSGPLAPSKSSEYVTLAGLGRGGPLENQAISFVIVEDIFYQKLDFNNFQRLLDKKYFRYFMTIYTNSLKLLKIETLD